MKSAFGFLNWNPPWGQISQRWNLFWDFSCDCKIRYPDFSIERNPSLVPRRSLLTPSSETQGQLVGTILPTNCPWVSEDVLTPLSARSLQDWPSRERLGTRLIKSYKVAKNNRKWHNNIGTTQGADSTYLRIFHDITSKWKGILSDRAWRTLFQTITWRTWRNYYQLYTTQSSRIP